MLARLLAILGRLPLSRVQHSQVIKFLLGKLHDRSSQKYVFLYSTGCIYKVYSRKSSLPQSNGMSCIKCLDDV